MPTFPSRGRPLPAAYRGHAGMPDRPVLLRRPQRHFSTPRAAS